MTKWLLDRVDSFPKNHRFIFGQRIADRALNILEVLVEAAYSPCKAGLLARANRDIEVLRWLIRMATDRKLLTPRLVQVLAFLWRADGKALPHTIRDA